MVPGEMPRTGSFHSLVKQPGARFPTFPNRSIMPNTPAKSVAASKTIWINLIIAVVAFFPAAQAWVQQHPTEALVLVNVLNGLVRLVTHGRIQLFAADDKFGALIGIALCSFLLATGACARAVPAHVTALRTSTYIVPHVTATRPQPAPLPAENQRSLPVPRASESDLVRALETGRLIQP